MAHCLPDRRQRSRRPVFRFDHRGPDPAARARVALSLGCEGGPGVAPRGRQRGRCRCFVGTTRRRSFAERRRRAHRGDSWRAEHQPGTPGSSDPIAERGRVRAVVHRRRPFGRADRDVLSSRRAGHCRLAARGRLAAAARVPSADAGKARDACPLRPADRFEQGDGLVGFPATGNRLSPFPAKVGVRTSLPAAPTGGKPDASARAADGRRSPCGGRQAGLPAGRPGLRDRSRRCRRAAPRRVGEVRLPDAPVDRRRLVRAIAGVVGRRSSPPFALAARGRYAGGGVGPVPRLRPLCRDCGGDAAVDRGVGTSRRRRRRVAHGADANGRRFRLPFARRVDSPAAG